MPFTAAFSFLATQEIDARQSPDIADDPSKIGGVAVTEILERLGATMEHGVTVDQMGGYSRHFDLIDHDGDGRHSKVEYIEKGNYLTPQARRGIFGAADGDGDGFVTKAEYILNRIITDEGKAIVQAMDDDKDGIVQDAEFIKHAGAKLSDAELARQVFAALDSDDDGAIRVGEYLRVWGRWARTGGKPPEQRIAARESESGDSSEGTNKERAGEKDAPENSRPNRVRRRPGGRGGPPAGNGGPRAGGPGRGGPGTGGPPRRGGREGAGPPSVDEVFERFDGDKDGKLSVKEIPEFVRQFILPADLNKDGAVTKGELLKHRASASDQLGGNGSGENRRSQRPDAE